VRGAQSDISSADVDATDSSDSSNPFALDAGGYSSNSYATPPYPGDTFTSSTPITQLVAPNETARIWGDPHVEDADGGKYDFQEKGVYNLLSDKGVMLNADFEGNKDDGPTYATQAGLVVAGHKVIIQKDGTAIVHDGENGEDVTLQDGQTRQLSDGSYITKKGNDVTVGTTEYKMEFATNQEHDNQKFMDIKISTKDGGVGLDGKNPTGLLGETFDAGTNQLTKPKQDPESYKRDTLFGTAPAPAPTPAPTPTPAPAPCPTPTPASKPPDKTPAPSPYNTKPPAPAPAPAPAPPPDKTPAPTPAPSPYNTKPPAPTPTPAPAPAPKPTTNTDQTKALAQIQKIAQMLLQLIQSFLGTFKTS
jgi:hypothetical protein